MNNVNAMARQTFGSTNPPAGFVGTSSSTATRNSRAGGDGEDPNEAQAPPGSYPTQHPYLLQAHPTGDTSFRHHGLQSSPTHRNRPTLHSPSLPNPQQLLVRHTLLSGQPEIHSDAVTGGRLSSQTYDLPMDSSSPRHDYSSGGTSVAANPSVSRSGAGREGNRIHSEIGGYGVVLEQDSRRENLVCPLCEKILREPMQTTCGHRFCRTCLDEATRLNKLCPLDDEKVVKSFPDRHCQREIDCLRVKCPHQPTCPWCGQLKELEDHLSICAFHPLPCPNPGCDEYLPRDLVQRHARERCDHRRVTCTYCRSPIPHTEVDQHIKRECPDYPVPCPNEGCVEQVTRSTLQHHRETECDAAEQPCLLGCGRQIRRKEADKHIADARTGAAHTHFILGQLQNVRQQLAERDTLIERQQFELKMLRSEMEDLVTRKVDLLAKDIIQRQASLVPGHFGGAAASSDFQERVEGELSSLTRRVRETSSKQESVQAIAENQTSLCEELTRQTDQLDLRVMELETTSYGGFLIWKIPRFSKLLQDGKNGTKTSHYSQPFYCGRYGYKSCARIYPNGDGAGHGKYVSLFFSVMAGDFDAVLPWPFQRRVTLTVLDQSPSRRHVSETFSPDVRSSSFQRPTSGMNVASGCPCFISHEVLNSMPHQYLRDDTLFLKIAVDITGMEHV